MGEGIGLVLPLPLPSSASFFFEIVLPGIIGGILSYPLLPAWARLESGTSGYVGFVGVSLMIGFIPRLLMSYLVDFTLGGFWPARIRECAMHNLQRHADAIVASLKTVPASGIIPPREFIKKFSDQRLLDAFVAEEGGKRKVYCPTLVGNATIAVVVDLYRHFELEATLQKITLPTLAAWVAQASFIRAYYLLPKELRTELRENQSTGLGLLRLSAIATGLVFVYLGDIALWPSLWGRNIVLAAVMAAIGRIAYTAGAIEFIGNLQTMRQLFLKISRDDILAFRASLTQATPQTQTEQLPPKTPS